MGAPAHPVIAGPVAGPRVWVRYTPAQTAGRLLLRAGIAAAIVWAARGMGVRWEWVADSPTQLADLFGRMLPPEWTFAGALLEPLLQTVNIATLGTALAVVLACPVAFLAARNPTPHRVSYLAARLLIVVSRSVDSLGRALLFILPRGPGPP